MATNLLVAEDHESARELIYHALDGEGYNLVFAKTGTEASSVLHRQNFAAALLDVSLPGVTGSELCRQIKSQSPSPPTPVILMSGALDRRELAEETSDSGADAFLAKPFSLEELRTLLRAFTRIHDREVEIQRLRSQLEGCGAPSESRRDVDTATSLDWSLPYHEFMKLARKVYFEHALIASKGNKSRLARTSGLDRSTLYVHLRNLGMLIPRAKR